MAENETATAAINSKIRLISISHLMLNDAKVTIIGRYAIAERKIDQFYTSQIVSLHAPPHDGATD